MEPDPLEPGATLTYRFEVAYDGPDDAEDAAVGFLLPEGTFAADVRTSQGERCAPTGSRSLVACHLGDLAVDSAAEVTLWTNSDSPPGTEITVLATMSSEDTADPVHSNTHLTTTVAGA